MTNPTNTDLAAALREIANTLPLGSALAVRLAADRLGESVPAEDGWIKWNPADHKHDDCPVESGTLTAVRFRNGEEHEDDSPEYWSWDDCGDWAIVAYRTVK